MSKFSWTFSRLENGLHHLAGLAEDGLTTIHLDMHPLALGQMLASEFLAMLDRRASEEAGAPTQPAPIAAPEPTPEQQQAEA